MSSAKNVFSIKDLENLTGIKAHTIRIWEKRYNILQPGRTGTNIRYYDSDSLQKLLNITLLHNYGYKISVISKYEPEMIPVMVRGIVSDKNARHHAINAFKVAMMHFDQDMFLSTYNRLLSEKSLREIFHDVFIPLMNEIGILWQTGTITPAHEHFIAALVRQKLIVNTESLTAFMPVNSEKVFVAFLPLHEIHDLGLLYLNYEITLNGYKSIYLGASVPIEDLQGIKKYFDNIIFVSYLTVPPDKETINDYAAQLNALVPNDGTTELWLCGRQIEYIDPEYMNAGTTLIYNFSDFVKKL